MMPKLLRALLFAVVPALVLAGCADDGAEEATDDAATDDGVFDNGVGGNATTDENETAAANDTEGCVSPEEILSGEASPDPTEPLGNQTSEACPEGNETQSP